MRPIDKMCTKMVEKAKFSIFLGFFYSHLLILCGFHLAFKLVKKKGYFCRIFVEMKS